MPKAASGKVKNPQIGEKRAAVIQRRRASKRQKDHQTEGGEDLREAVTSRAPAAVIDKSAAGARWIGHQRAEGRRPAAG